MRHRAFTQVVARGGRQLPVLRALLLATALLLVAACGAPTTRSITIGLGDTVEQQLIAEVYAQTLRRAGAEVAIQPVGDRAGRMAALDAADVDLVVDQTATLTGFLGAEVVLTAQPDSSDGQAVAKAAYASLSAALPTGLSLADYALASTSALGTDNYVAVYRSGRLTRHELIAINKITGELTTDQVDELSTKVEAGGDRSELVTAWLDSRG